MVCLCGDGTHTVHIKELPLCLSQISKSNVVDDMVESNRVLYSEGEKPDHVVSPPKLIYVYMNTKLLVV